MKTQLTTALILALSSVSAAYATTPANPVERPLTLADGEVQINAAVLYGKRADNDSKWDGALNVGYGITDNWMLDFSGITYRFLPREKNKSGLELAANIGFRGALESDQYGDSDGYGATVLGKYVFNPDSAINFAVGYTKWNEDRRDDKKEFDYTIGFEQRVLDNLTLSTSYTYRDLSDFNQKHAYNLAVGLNYNLAQNLDVGLFYARTDFDYQGNGYNADDHYKNGYSASVTYRF